jgi:hypothetical protein
MNTTPLLLVPLASLGLLTTSPTPPADAGANLDSFLEQLDATPERPADLAPARVTPQGLTTGALQPASGLHSAARGLTPKDDWQRLFPRYAKRD